jgi:hypothetical protein
MIYFNLFFVCSNLFQITYNKTYLHLFFRHRDDILQLHSNKIFTVDSMFYNSYLEYFLSNGGRSAEHAM